MKQLFHPDRDAQMGRRVGAQIVPSAITTPCRDSSVLKMRASCVDQHSPCCMIGRGERFEERLLDDIQAAKYASKVFMIAPGFFNAAAIDLPHRAKTP